MISSRLVEFSGSGFWSILSRWKMRGMPDVHLLKDSRTTFTRLCRRKASVKVTKYPTIVEMQSDVSVADQDRISGAPACRRRAIASKVVSMSWIPSFLILSSNSGSGMMECSLTKGKISSSACYSLSVR